MSDFQIETVSDFQVKARSDSQVKCIGISELDPYPEYKDSDVEWIGKIPKEWDTVRIKWLSPVKRGASPRPIDNPIYFDDDGDFSWVRIADVTSSERYLEETTQKLSKLGSSLSVKQYPGDFFVSIAGSVGKPIITKIKCCIHDGFVWFPYLKLNSEYLYYMFTSGEPYKGLGKLGTQLNLNTETVGNISIPLPPDEHEINEIVIFLDRETSRIDTLIEKKQRFIELLKEKRSALISHAVTKGLDADVPMTNSGIEWIGKIPIGWHITKLKYLVNLRNEKTNNVINYSTKIALENIESFTGKLLNSYSDFEGDGTIIKEGDVLFNKLRPYLCKAVIAPSEGVAVGELLVFRIQETLLESKFLLYRILTHEFISLVDGATYGTKMPRASWEFIKNIEIPVPSLPEQQAIVSYLDRETAQIDILIEKIKQSIEYLKEYRTALISDAITGKIDVRRATCE